MKAFLSHSSKDKDFVRKVYDEIGPMLCEYDEFTFDYTLNVKAIRASLARSELFVAFLSAQSITSTFVKEEYRQALEAMGRGGLTSVMIFALDETSFKELPEWLREFNVVTRQSSPQACARRIQSRLLEVDAAKRDAGMLYLGRDADESILRKALAVPASKIPLALHVVGHHGVGRRTFIEQTLKKVLPRVFSDCIPVTVQRHDGPEELYRSLYGLNANATLKETLESFSKFAIRSKDEQAELVHAQMVEMNENGEFIIIIDDGGLYDEEGDYQDIFIRLLALSESSKRPVFGVVQSRMMPAQKKVHRNRSFHHFLNTLDDESVKEILSFLFHELEIEYTEAEMSSIVSLLDGHPYNIRFAVEFANQYGIQSLISDPTDLIEWKRRRAGDFLDRIEFSDVEGDVLSLLTEYRHVADDMILELVERGGVDTVEALRRLQDFCCIELREGYFYVSPPVRDAVAKDKRFERPVSWKKEIGAKICEAVSDYRDDDHIPLSIIESATIAAAQGASAPFFISALILPSHLLRVGRDHYDRRRWARAIEFCERALEGKDRLPEDAQIEALRIIALASTRIDGADLYSGAIERLRGYHTPYARRAAFFAQGFHARSNNRLDDAERMFKEAWKLAKRNESVNRELASIYCKQRRFAEAEPYARAAYELAPTSPYILDIMAETLLGKEKEGLPVDIAELARVLDALQRYGDAPGISFYLVRLAQQLIKAGDAPGAVAAAARAIARTPDLLATYFIHADALMALRKPGEAERDLTKIKEILANAGGASEGDTVKAVDLEVSIHLERGSFSLAKQALDRAPQLPRYVRDRLTNLIAQAVAFNPSGADSALRLWAKQHTA